jgi:hypothetical protein
MQDEKQEQEEMIFYEDIRADVETAVYVFASFEEMDMAILGAEVERQIKKAKKNCIEIICKGIQSLRDSYD